MKELFKNTDKTKRDAIINAALDEFATNRYDKASTNNIVKNAGISKGLLYHYFKNKKELYDYLEVFSITTVFEPILEQIDWDETDLFLRIEKIVLIKFKVLAKYPKITSFTKVMFNNKPIEELRAFSEKYIPDAYNKIYNEGVDFSLFKEGVDLPRIIKMTQWIFEKLGDEWSSLPSVGLENIQESMNELEKELLIYIKMLKEAFYR